MKFTDSDVKSITVRLAKDAQEIKAAQRLRYEVFFEEFNAKPTPEAARLRLDFDAYDAYADHIVVIDSAAKPEKIIGTYRLLKRAEAEAHGQFYSSSEYNLDVLLNSGASLLELGRSCVLPEYRTRPVLQLLWQGIADYIAEHHIGILFGCASLQGTDPTKHEESLSYLYHYHLAPEALRPRTLDDHYVNMNILPKAAINPRRAFNNLPPLLKGYLRAGASVGDGAYLDHQFGTTDVLILVQTHMLAERYRKHYERKIQRALPGSSDIEDTDNLIDEVIE